MTRRAFSLIELLLSVFILAIGIISVSALFPAGIAQQQQTKDDQLGPVVAEQALGLIRSRVRADDFGTFEDFGITNVLFESTIADGYAFRPGPGDWSWIRPGVIRTVQQGLQVSAADQPGTIDIFSHVAQRTGGAADEFCEFPGGIPFGTVPPYPIRLFGAPYSLTRASTPLANETPAQQRLRAPLVLITPQERWWPASTAGVPPSSPPEYAWECMFRRHGGVVQVAIFVFRIVGVGGAAREWRAARPGQQSSYENGISGASLALPPVPYRRVPAASGTTALSGTSRDSASNQVDLGWTQPPGLPGPDFPRLDMSRPGPFTTGQVGQGPATEAGGLGQGLLPGDFPSAALAPVQHQWQFPGQWLVDNNGNVHRVVVGRRNASDPVQLRLAAPVPRVPAAQVYVDYEAGALTNRGVRTLHYVPTIIDTNGTQLIPVYATVRDL